MLILAINPGSTSTKIAVYKGKQGLWKETIEHSVKEVGSFAKITDQSGFRTATILNILKKRGCAMEQFSAVVGRGGLLKPLVGGTYRVDEYLVNELQNAPEGEHASNLGGIIAYQLAQSVSVPAYIVDPVAVDELEPHARLSGHPVIPRVSLSHALNMKAVARKVAAQRGKSYREMNLLMAHLGGGISVAAHRKGRMIDVNNANAEGPFSPERCGTLPSRQLVKLCFSGRYNQEEMFTLLNKEGGLYAYLGIKDVREAEKRMAGGDEQARLVLEAMCYQVAKEIGAMSAVLAGEVECIVLTGGIAYSDFITGEIIRRVSFIAPVVVVPGEEEMEALALGALRVLQQEEEALTYRA